jgi:hypothetical protein
MLPSGSADRPPTPPRRAAIPWRSLSCLISNFEMPVEMSRSPIIEVFEGYHSAAQCSQGDFKLQRRGTAPSLASAVTSPMTSPLKILLGCVRFHCPEPAFAADSEALDDEPPFPPRDSDAEEEPHMDDSSRACRRWQPECAITVLAVARELETLPPDLNPDLAEIGKYFRESGFRESRFGRDREIFQGIRISGIPIWPGWEDSGFRESRFGRDGGIRDSRYLDLAGVGRIHPDARASGILGSGLRLVPHWRTIDNQTIGPRCRLLCFPPNCSY